MKKLFEMPELFTLDGSPFTGEGGLHPLGGFGPACAGGCESGCGGGCEPGYGVNDWM